MGARAGLQGKHILVVDDFCTEGQSFEAARQLLLAAGAAQVTCLCFDRYWDEYIVQMPRKGLVIDPWRRTWYFDGDFVAETKRTIVDANASVFAEQLAGLKVPRLIQVDREER